MDQIAVMSDVHGNMPALETVLGDIRQRGISRILCLGDLVGKGPDSARAVDVCREVCAEIVRGNWDDFIAHDTDNPTLQWHQQRLGPERLRYLAALPGTIEFVLGGRHVRLFHASQIGVYNRVRMDAPLDIHMAMFDNTPFTGAGHVPDVVGYGDIHGAFLRSFRQRMLFNAGSVGNPLDLPLASYAILEGQQGSTAPGAVSVQFVRLPYDIERAIRDAEAVGMPELQPYAEELRTARYRGAQTAIA